MFNFGSILEACNLKLHKLETLLRMKTVAVDLLIRRLTLLKSDF